MTPFKPRDPDFRASVQRHFSAQGFLALLGVSLERAEPGLAEYRMPFRADLGQQNGVFHGGAIGAVAEAVMGGAAATLVSAGANVMGASYLLNLLSPGRGVSLLARGTVLKPGRRLIVCRADIFVEAADGSQVLCAAGQGTMAVIEPPAGA